MSETEKEQISEDEEDEGINLLDYLIILAKHKKLIIGITLPVAIITFILTLFSGSFYQVDISILPPQKQEVNLPSQFVSQFGIFPSKGGDVLSKQELLVEIIKSRTFTSRIIERFNLKGSYGAENMQAARKVFLENINIEPDFTDAKQFSFKRESPLIKLFVRDRTPQKAAGIANGLVEELKVFINTLAISEASQRRLFFEEQLKQVSDAVIESEEEIKIFQERTGLIKMEAQTNMVINKVAHLQAQITANEIQLQVMESYTTSDNPDYQIIKDTVKVLKKELAKLEANEKNSRDNIIPTSTIPALGLEYKRILRQLRFNESLYEIMIKQYETAKLDEAKDAILIQVIDKAIIPDEEAMVTVRIFGRKKALVATCFAFFFACFMALFMEYRERSSKNGENSERMETLKRYLSFKKQ